MADAAPADATAASVVTTGYDPSEPEVVGASTRANTDTGNPSGPALGTPFGNINYQRAMVSTVVATAQIHELR